MIERLHALGRLVAASPFDAILISHEINVSYLSGFTGDSSWLLVDGDGDATILSDRRYETQLAQECPQLKHAIRPPHQKLEELLAEVLQGASMSSIRSIGFEADHVSIGTYCKWKAGSPNVVWTETSGIVEGLRSIKDATELAAIRRSIDIAQRAFMSVTAKLTTRMTEIEVAHELEATMRFLGASGVSFPPIVGAEPRGALPHYRPGHEPLGKARTLLIDWGAKFDGYCSDLTRTLHQPLQKSSTSARFESAYAAVLEAHDAAIEMIAPGVDARAVDQRARDVLTRAGLANEFKHGLGHSFGLQIHEDPRMGPSSEQVLREGMVLTVEPGVYFEGEFGIRIENDVLVTSSGCERLSNLPSGLDDNLLIL